MKLQSTTKMTSRMFGEDWECPGCGDPSYDSYNIDHSYLDTMFYRHSSAFMNAHPSLGSSHRFDSSMKFNLINHIDNNSGC